MPKKLTIDCSFDPALEHPCLPNYKPDKIKSGRYLQSYFWGTPDGDFKYIVGAHLTIANYKSFRRKKWSDEQIINACLDYFNSFTTKKRKTKKLKYKYGHLKLTKFDKKSPGTFTVRLLTTEKKNPNFWGKGIEFPTTRIKRGK